MATDELRPSGWVGWSPAYPLWSLVAIGLEIVVIYALTAGWKEARPVLRR